MAHAEHRRRRPDRAGLELKLAAVEQRIMQNKRAAKKGRKASERLDDLRAEARSYREALAKLM